MRKRISRWIWPVMTALAIVGIVIGVARGEFAAVNRWGHTLCTSCIGLGK